MPNNKQQNGQNLAKKVQYRPRVTYSPLARSEYARVTRECFESSFHSLLAITRKRCSLSSLAKYFTRFTREYIECLRVKNRFISTIYQRATTCNINAEG